MERTVPRRDRDDYFQAAREFDRSKARDPGQPSGETKSEGSRETNLVIAGLELAKISSFYFSLKHIFPSNNMISAKKLIKLAKKWQKLAALRRKRIALPQMETSSCSTSEMADKGHFVFYSTDQKRFLLPLNYLNNEIVRELLKLAEEEFGLPGNGPLTLPCDAELIEYVIGLIKQGITRDLEKALLVSIASSRCSLLSDLHHQVTDHQLPICSS
ncbi:hypothetical protein SADUNF_Sadunf17G0040500 [Salix dunnii]|uniref:SAUR-like auxin-responsive protein family n=1 Tax=Salix dunnii TaxID=1413687 RepID=A0A835J6C5_9ROSI|nr:hypothetical protein SADUNF_Sadunf17G0040500 [Salix dunnii]